MTDFIEYIKKDPKVEKEISQITEKCKKKSYATKLKIEHNALFQSIDFKQTITILSETISGVDIQTEK